MVTRKRVRSCPGGRGRRGERYGLNSERKGPGRCVRAAAGVRSSGAELRGRFAAGSSLPRLGTLPPWHLQKPAVSQIVLGRRQHFSSRTAGLYVPNLNVLPLGRLSSVTLPPATSGRSLGPSRTSRRSRAHSCRQKARCHRSLLTSEGLRVSCLLSPMVGFSKTADSLRSGPVCFISDRSG